MTFIWDDKTRGHVKRGSLTSTVRPQQSHYLTLLDVERHMVGNGAAPITFHQSFCMKLLAWQPLHEHIIKLFNCLPIGNGLFLPVVLLLLNNIFWHICSLCCIFCHKINKKRNNNDV